MLRARPVFPAAIVLAAVMLGGCGSSDQTPTTPAPPAPSPSPTPSPVPPAPGNPGQQPPSRLISYTYPLRLSSNRRFLVDQDLRPFVLNGDAAWSLMAQPTRADAQTYLTNRRQLGFNAVLVSLIEHKFADRAPRNSNGDAPFGSSGRLAQPNEAYFAAADEIIRIADSLNIVVLLAPLYIGHDCGNEGWCAEIRNSSLADLHAWGQYVGNRYRSFRNIIWVIGGDQDPVASGIGDKVREFVAGLRETDTVHVMTAHNGPEQSARDPWPNESWLDVNNVYTYNSTAAASLGQYHRTPFMPLFLVESAYEHEHGSTPLSLRTQAYNAVLSGATVGQVFGNCPIWNFGFSAGFCSSSNWKNELTSSGSQTVAYVGWLLSSRSFQLLEPDDNHTVLTAGFQSGSAARTSDGATVIAYLPSSRTVTVFMTMIAGTTARAWWFNPVTAQAMMIGDFPTTGMRNFTSPSEQDWVLVLDNAALNLAAPGS